MLLWLASKCFLIAPGQKDSELFTVIRNGFCELLVSVVFMRVQAKIETTADMVFIFVLYVVACLRALFCEKVDLMIYIFTAAYFLQNFVVNTIDFVTFNRFIGFYADKEFH